MTRSFHLAIGYSKYCVMCFFPVNYYRCMVKERLDGRFIGCHADSPPNKNLMGTVAKWFWDHFVCLSVARCHDIINLRMRLFYYFKIIRNSVLVN